MLPRVTPSILLSSLLLSPQFGEVLDSYEVTGNDNITINNESGHNIISNMQMYFLKAGAGATFNVLSGSLDVDLSISNMDKVQNNVTFNISQGGELNLTSGKNGFSQGIFEGSNTTLRADIAGTLNGNISNDGTSDITIKEGGTMNGNISQNAGTLTARIEGKLEGGIVVGQGTTQTHLWAYENSGAQGKNPTITENITQEGGRLNGILKGLTLKGNLTQNGGTSDIAFWQSKFDGSVTLSRSNSLIHFYGSKITSVSTIEGTNTIELLSGSHMTGYTGTDSTSTIKLDNISSMQDASQTRGTLNINAKNSEVKGSITGNQARLDISLTRSQMTGSIANSGEFIVGNTTGVTNISAENAKIGGNITQNGGQIRTNLETTTLEGGFIQNGGNLVHFQAHNSTISQGINLTGINAMFSRKQITIGETKINNGIRIQNAIDAITGSISENSKVTGGYSQIGEGERVQLTFQDSSSLEGGINVQNSTTTTIFDPTDKREYKTTLIFQNKSGYLGGVVSNNNSTWIELNENSTGDGNIAITGGDAYIKGMTGSTFNGNLTSNDSRETRLYLGTGIFNGNVTQTNGKQHISLIQNANLNGNVSNLNTESVFAIDTNSTMTGSYTQDNGSLLLLMGGNSTVTGSFTLNDVNTTLGNGTAEIHAETIQGNLTQNDGSLGGLINGLTLEGKFTQNGGTADVTFGKANFHNPTDINHAISSKVTFDNQSRLKDYTINNSPKRNGQIVNSLKLDHQTILKGNFTLNHSSSTLSILNNSRITGNITSGDEDSELVMDTKGGDIGGDINIANGKVSGDFENSKIEGNLNLTDANSHFHFKDSAIGKNIHIIRGTTLMTLDGTSVGGWFKMEQEGPKNPTLKLKISNGSSIGKDLTFDKTKAFLGGDGIGSVIKGNLISDNSILTNGGAKYGGSGDPYPISGLTVQGEFKQNQGILDLIFSNKSDIQGQTTITNPEFFNLVIKDHSQIGKFDITGGEHNSLTLQDNSTHQGGMTLNDTTITISALQNSTMTGNINAQKDKSNTKIILDSSQLLGSITQNNGDLKLEYQNQSNMQGRIDLSNLEANINLNSSSIIGGLSALKSKVFVNLNNNSLMQSDIVSTNSIININANASILGGSIRHTGTSQEGEFEFVGNFSNNSTLNNTETTLIGNMKINAYDSTINSQKFEVVNGRFDLSLNHSFGTIESLKAGGPNTINILTDNFSNSSITSLSITDKAQLTLVAQNGAIIAGNLSTEEESRAILTSLENANIRFDITPQNNAFLEIALNGGMMQGKVVQNSPTLGKAVLGTNGRYGGRWIMTDDSAIRDLVINNSSAHVQDIEGRMKQDSFNTQISMVDMTKDSLGASRIGLQLIPNNAEIQEGQTRAKTLSLANLSGLNGVFRVYTDIGAELSDKLTTQRASGNHIIQVYYNPATFTQNIDDKYIVVAHVDDLQTSASFEGGYTDIGVQTYKTDLLKVNAKDGKGFDWILGKTQNTGPSYGTKVIASIMQSQYRSFSLQNETLNQRLGELRGIKRIDGLWARYSMGKTKTQESDTHIPLEDNFYSVWVGYDQNLLNLKGQDFYGFALSYTLIDPQSKDYTGKIHNIGFNFYNVFIARNDFYVDLVAKYILSQGTYDVSYFSLSKNKPKYINHKLMFNVEFGKKFRLGDEERQNYFYLQPEAQITSGYIHHNDITFIDLSNTLIKAHLPYSFPVIMRAGLNAAYSMNYFSFKGDIRLGTSLIYEMSTGGRIALNDEQSEIDYRFRGDFRMMLHAGANLILNDSSRLYFEASTEFLGETNIVYGINAGVRFTFGHKNTRKLKVPSSLTPPPPPKPQYDPRNIPTITDNTKVDIQNNKTMKKTPYSQDYFINTRKSFRDKTSINH